MAISTDPTVLVAQSRCFDTCIPPGDQPAVKTYLLAQIAGITDPGVVLNNARCFNSCISEGAQLFVQAYLSALLSGQSTDPSTIANAARCFSSCVPAGALPALINFNLASKAGGSMDPSTLANAARCFSSCIPVHFQLAAQTYLMAVSAGVSTDPKVLLATRSVANFIGGLPPGLPLMILGDAMAVWAGLSSQPTVPTGFAFASNLPFTALVASWDTPPVGIIQTEVWTSTDNITFSQSAIVLAPGNTTSFAIPAIGSSLYCKILWDSSNTVGPFTGVLQFTHTNWETRANTNSAAVILGPSKSVQNNLYSALANAGILSKILTLGFFENQSGNHVLICTTPVVNTAGSDPWGAVNLGDAMVGAQGLTVIGGPGVGATSGILGTGMPSDTDAGFTIYAITAASVAGAFAIGYTNNAGTIAAGFKINDGGSLRAAMWNDTSQLTPATPGAGYFSMNRTGATAYSLYYASAGTPHASIASSALASGSRSANGISLFSANAFELGQSEFGTVNNTLGCLAIHHGLTAAESALFYAALSAARAFVGMSVP